MISRVVKSVTPIHFIEMSSEAIEAVLSGLEAGVGTADGVALPMVLETRRGRGGGSSTSGRHSLEYSLKESVGSSQELRYWPDLLEEGP